MTKNRDMVPEPPSAGADAAPAPRQRAENSLAGSALAASALPASPVPAKARGATTPFTLQALHELQVHQVELEMQNEELRRTQLELAAARERYFDLYDLAPVGYCTVSEKGIILEANIAAAALLGVARSELVGQQVSKFVAKASQDAFYLHRKQLLVRGESHTCELQMLHQKGQQLWVSLTTTSAQDNSGLTVQRMVLNDITSLKTLGLALQESEAFKLAILNSLHAEIAVIDINGVIQAVNDPWRRFARANGLTASQAAAVAGVGSNYLSACTPVPGAEPEEQSSAYQGIQAVLTGALPSFTLEYPCHSPTQQRWFAMVVLPLEQNASTGAVITHTNITAHKLLGQALQVKNDELEGARLVAEKANRAKSEFLSSMSHELRTPLGAILGFAQLIDSGLPKPTPHQKRSVEQILQAGWFQLELINEILDLAVVESGKLSLSQEPVSLAQVMLECKAMVEALAHSQGVTLTFPTLEVPYIVNADRTRIKQVLINLLSNAIKYNHEGGSVVVRCIEVGVERLRICVEDTGDGLSPEKMSQLFQPFNRLGRETGSVQGTGIGLVMTKRLVELMDGTIGVQSTVGTGSVFWVEMSLLSNQNELEGSKLPNRYAPPAVLSDEKKMQCLLYVEDNPANLMLVESIMERRSEIRLLTAKDGISGIAKAREFLPNVILMDINLPGISGLNALGILAADPLTAHIPVIALSANAMRNDIEAGMKAGFFKYLTKPIKIDEFMATLDDAMKFSETSHSQHVYKEKLQ